MSRERYPLEAARTLRAEEEAARGRALAGAVGVHDDAVRAREAAERAVAAHRDETARIAAEELARDRAGRSAGEMLRAQDFLAARRRDEARLDARLRSARDAEREAGAAVERARAALAEAVAEARAIERHRERWDAEREKASEKREEDDADEVRRGPR